MATRVAILIDGSALSEQAVKYTLRAGPDAYDAVHLIGAVDCVYLKALAGNSLERVQTAMLKEPVADALTSYLRKHRIDVLIMTTRSPNTLDRIWRVRVRNGRVRGVDSQAVVRPLCAA